MQQKVRRVMSINIKTSGAHHIALRSTNLERSKRFYTETLGFSIIKETPEIKYIYKPTIGVGTGMFSFYGDLYQKHFQPY